MKIAKYKPKQNLTKKTIETLLNEIFVLGSQDKNELAIKRYEHSIGITT